MASGSVHSVDDIGALSSSLTLFMLVVMKKYRSFSPDPDEEPDPMLAQSPSRSSRSNRFEASTLPMHPNMPTVALGSIGAAFYQWGRSVQCFPLSRFSTTIGYFRLAFRLALRRMNRIAGLLRAVCVGLLRRCESLNLRNPIPVWAVGHRSITSAGRMA